MGKKPLKFIALLVKLTIERHDKNKQQKLIDIELRANGGLHGCEKLGQRANGMEKYPGNVVINNEKQTINNEEM